MSAGYWWVGREATVGGLRIEGPVRVDIVATVGNGQTPVVQARDLDVPPFVALSGELQAYGDHSLSIAALEATAEKVAGELATRYRAAAALLECHDATGINLATFGEVGTFVNNMLRGIHHPPFVDNKV